MSDVLVSLEGPMLWLTINRPHKRNALSTSVAASLVAAISSAGRDVRAVVIAGTPPVFCAGGDLAALSEFANHGAGEVTDMVYGHFHGNAFAGVSRVGLHRSKATLRRACDDRLDHELATLGAVQGALIAGPEFREVAARFLRP